MDRVAIAAAVMEPTPAVLAERARRLDANRGGRATLWKAYKATTR